LCSVVVPIVTIEAINGINQSEVNATYNKDFNLTCKVESYPPAVVYWEVNDKQVSNNSVVVKENTMDKTITIVVMVDTSERGATITYTCVAGNRVNETDRSSTNSINVIIQGKILYDEYTIPVTTNSLCPQALSMYMLCINYI